MKGPYYSLLLILFSAVSAVSAVSTQAQAVAGDWQGTLKVANVELRLVLHVTKDEKGALRATLDSPDQNAMGFVVNSISFAEPDLKFEIQQIGGSYQGKLKADRSAISGTWTQGDSSAPLEFSRATPTAELKKRVPKPSDIDGNWEGAVDTGAQKLRLVLHIVTYEDGMSATLDSPDQKVMGLPVTVIRREGAKLNFEMKQLAGSFEGTIDQELTTIDGTWSQGGGSVSLVLKRGLVAPKEKKPSGSM
jgi:uncharacterized protein